MVRGQLPSAGVRVSVFSRTDSEVLPIESTLVCRADVVNVEEEPLEFKLFNRTGDGVTGYHFDPITVNREERSDVSNEKPKPKRRLKRAEPSDAEAVPARRSARIATRSRHSDVGS